MNLMSVYDRLPVFAQNMAFSYMGSRIRKTRFGSGFYRMLQEFESHEAWSKDELFEWRDARMRELVVHCYNTVPFYREVMDEGGIDPLSIKTGDDLKCLPVIDKALVKAQPKAFVSSKSADYNILPVHTSGTSGSGFRFDSTVECQQAQFACFWRYYHKHGLDLTTWQAQFSSRAVVPRRISDAPFWRVDKPGKRYYMSAFHESPANMQSYYDLIVEKRFPWISGYPSLMVLLAQWMNERGLSFDFVRVVTCGAENLLEHQADAMEHAFGVRPVQTYGQTENVAIFSTEPDGRILVDEDFSVVEFIDGPSGGGRALLVLASSILPRPFFATTLGMWSNWATALAVDARSLRSMGGKRTMYVCRTAQGLEGSITFSKIRHILRKRRFSSCQIIHCFYASSESRIYA